MKKIWITFSTSFKRLMKTFNINSSMYSFFHILLTKTNHDHLENFKRIQKKIVKNSVNPTASFDHKYIWNKLLVVCIWRHQNMTIQIMINLHQILIWLEDHTTCLCTKFEVIWTNQNRVIGRRSWRIFYYVIWENGLVGNLLLTIVAATI